MGEEREQEESKIQGVGGGWSVNFAFGAPYYLCACFPPWILPVLWILHIPKGLSPGGQATGETDTWKDTELSAILDYHPTLCI